MVTARAPKPAPAPPAISPLLLGFIRNAVAPTLVEIYKREAAKKETLSQEPGAVIRLEFVK